MSCNNPIAAGPHQRYSNISGHMHACIIIVWPAWGHPTNFMCGLETSNNNSKLYNLAEILLNFKSAKIHFKHHFSEFWHF